MIPREMSIIPKSRTIIERLVIIKNDSKIPMNGISGNFPSEIGIINPSCIGFLYL